MGSDLREQGWIRGNEVELEGNWIGWFRKWSRTGGNGVGLEGSDWGG